jgi:hypothetical protein
MAKSQKFKQLENELSALGYGLEHQYVILGYGGCVEASFSTLSEVDKWIGHEESRRMGYGGGDDEC